MMKCVLFAALLGMVAFVHSAPQSDATIENGNGNYNWEFDTRDGIKQDAKGQLHDGPLEDGTSGQVAEGSFSYNAPDGRLITVTYINDETGYRAKTVYSR